MPYLQLVPACHAEPSAKQTAASSVNLIILNSWDHGCGLRVKSNVAEVDALEAWFHLRQLDNWSFGTDLRPFFHITSSLDDTGRLHTYLWLGGSDNAHYFCILTCRPVVFSLPYSPKGIFSKPWGPTLWFSLRTFNRFHVHPICFRNFECHWLC